jgi:hypothetical protein
MENNGMGTEIYDFISASGDTLFHGHPVGVTVASAVYSAVYFTFPLYPMGEETAREIFNFAMNFLGEQQSGINGYIDEKTLPRSFLSQNFPNPFNADTKINFRLSQASQIKLAVYNILGQEIEILIEGDYAAGSHAVTWDGGVLPSGVYFYRLITNDGSLARRMTLLR